MLASNTPASNPARETAPLPDRTPQPTVTGTPPAEEPFGFTPVTSLPSRKTADGQSAKSRPQPAKAKPATQTIIPVTSGTVSSEPTPEEARKKVLNTIIEQKLDSIFNR